MFRIIQQIAQRAHETAVQRGQDVSAPGCMAAAGVEQAEYWKAVDEGRKLSDKAITKIMDVAPEDFVEAYEANIHNTDYDELADLLIIAATWYYSTSISGGEKFDPTRSIDVMLATGILAFVIDRLTATTQMATILNADRLRNVVNLKLRFNETR